MPDPTGAVATDAIRTAPSKDTLATRARAYVESAASSPREVMGVSLDEALVVYGEYFVDTVHMGGHLRMMRIQ